MERHWIQDCPDLIAAAAAAAGDSGSDADGVTPQQNCCDLLIWLSVANLEDDHHKNEYIHNNTNNDSNDKDATVDSNEEERVARNAATAPPHNHIPCRPGGARRSLDEISGDEAKEKSNVAVPAAQKIISNEELIESKADNLLPPVIYIQRAAPTDHDDSSCQPLCRPSGGRDKAYHPLPHGDCGDGIENPYRLGENAILDKYWAQRKRLFSRFDDGIKLDREGWFSVTPEAIANHIAHRMVSSCGSSTFTITSATAGATDTKNIDGSMAGLVLLDAFAGVGGNAIAFANRSEVSLVICVDTSSERLRLAANNCQIYKVPTAKVVFIHGDACKVLASYKNGARVETSVPKDDETLIASTIAVSDQDCGYVFGGYERLPKRLDAIFLSPPWGGVEYGLIGPRHFNLSCIHLDSNNNKVDGVDLLRKAVAALPADQQNIGYFLPRNVNGMTFAQNCHECGIRGCVEMEQNILNYKLKTVTAYIDSGGSCTLA